MENYTLKTTAYHDIMSFGQVSRAHHNLNKLAYEMWLARADHPTRTADVNTLAGMIDSDRSNVLRLFKKRPGFVKVIEVIDGRRSVGYYYQKEFYKEAENQGAGYYPFNTAPLVRADWPAEQVLSETPESLSTIIYTGQREKGNPVKVETVDLSEDGENLTRIIANRAILGPRINEELDRNLELVRQGVSLDLDKLESTITVLLSLYNWIKSSPDHPENALILHEMRGQ